MFRIEDTLSPNDFGVNKGEAQILDQRPAFEARRFERELRARRELAGEKLKQDKEEEKKKVDSKRYQDIASLKQVGILPADRDNIAQLQKDVQDFTYANARALHEGDPKATMEWQDLFAKANATAIRSKDFNDEMQKTRNFINSQGGAEAFYPNEIENFNLGYNTPNDGSYDLSKYTLNKRFNTQDYINKTLNPFIENIAKQGAHDWINPLTGDKTSYTNDNLTPQESEKIFKSSMLANQKVFREEAFNLSQDQEAQKQFGNDVNAYIKDKYFQQFLVKPDIKKFDGKDTKDEGGGYIKTNPTKDKPMSLYINTLSQDGVKYNKTSANVYQDFTLPKKDRIDVILSLPETAIATENNRPLYDVGSVNFTSNQIKVVPVYTKGTVTKGFIGKKDREGKVRDKEVSLENRVVPADKEEQAKKDGLVRYVPMAFGLATKKTDESNPDTNDNTHPLTDNTSVMVPAEELRGGLGKNVKMLDEANAYADELNKGLGNRMAETKKLSPAEWNTKWSSLKKGETLVGLDGNTYTKK